MHSPPENTANRCRHRAPENEVEEGGGREKAEEMKRKVFGEGDPRKREKEATMASSSAVAVSGGLHGGRRE